MYYLFIGWGLGENSNDLYSLAYKEVYLMGFKICVMCETFYTDEVDYCSECGYKES